jgi:hypothetical protein
VVGISIAHICTVIGFLRGKGKGKFHPITGHKGPQVSLTTALDGVGGQRHAPATLPTGKIRYPLYRRLGWPQGPVWTGTENLAPTGIQSPDPPTRS